MFYHKTIINLVFPVLNIILTHMVNTQKVYGWIQSIVTALNSMEMLTGINAQSQSQGQGLECGQVLLLFSDGEKLFYVTSVLLLMPVSCSITTAASGRSRRNVYQHRNKDVDELRDHILE